MPRIRTIKPDFWTDSAMVGLSPWARLLYIGTWNFAMCDRGHLADDLTALKLKVLPADDVDMDQVLAELIDAGRIERRHTSAGKSYLVAPKLPEHQKCDSRWNPRCPYCADEDAPSHTEPPEVSPKLAESRAHSTDLTVGKESKGKESKKHSITADAVTDTATPAPKPKPGSDDDPDFTRYWLLWPRKVGKGQARTAWRAAVKKTDPGVIVDRATVFASRCARDGTEQRFIPHPSTWLNGERWHDEPDQRQHTRVSGDPEGIWT